MKIRTDFVTNSSSQSYISISITDSELARLCREYKLNLDVRGDIVTYKYNDVEGGANFIEPKGKDFVDWFLNFIKFMDVADVNACKQIKANRKNIKDSFEKSVIIVSHFDEEDGSYWEERRNKNAIELKGFDRRSWDKVWDTIDHDEIAKLYDGRDIDSISPSNYPLRQLISDNWGFQRDIQSQSDKDVVFIRKMMDQYGTTQILPKGNRKNHLKNKKNKYVIDPKSKNRASESTTQISNNTGSFDGQKFVTTGLTAADDRWVKEQVESRGGEYKPKFVVSLNYLIYNPDYGHETVKYTKAKEQINKGKNVKIITLDEFKKILK